MTTKYPSSIDGYSEIRIVRDNIDEIVGSDHNDLRSAVIALETTIGTNPQGIFGNVAARLEDAYYNIERHASGLPPRHSDNVIESSSKSYGSFSISGANVSLQLTEILELLNNHTQGSTPQHTDSNITTTAKSGSPYSLSSGTVLSQITSLLGNLNSSVVYPGSSPTGFADGYQLPSSYISSAITQIIKQLGDSSNVGTSKIYGNTISGSPNSISAGTLRSQLSTILNYVNSIPSGSVDIAPLMEKAFDGFVLDGMEVTESGGGATASVASGGIICNGYLRRHTGGSASVPATPGTYYVYAQISGGGIIIGCNNLTNLPFNPVNPIVLLHKITHSGAAWTSDSDIRRFGSLINNKNYFTVGTKPTSGSDGYGCDFISIRAAVEYIKAMDGNTPQKMIAPKRIILVSDILINSTDDMEISLDAYGIEIDGAGRRISTNIDTHVFSIEADDITLRNIILESRLTSAGTSLCLARIGNSSDVKNARVVNCSSTKHTGSNGVPYFLRFGDAAGARTISNCVISNNIAEVVTGGIEYVSTNNYHTILNGSIIIGNKIFQDTMASSTKSGIKASTHCIIEDNIIEGGFDTGVFLASPTQCKVSGNAIFGYQSSTVYMNSGIAVWNDLSAQDNGTVITDNTIKGVNNYGINCRAGSGYGQFLLITENVIDNYNEVGSSPATMVGIKSTGSETIVSNNKILAPGVHAIENVTQAVGNQIFGKSSLVTTSAIEIMSGASGVMVNSNWIYGCQGIGIDANDSASSIICDNIISGITGSTIGIDNVGNYTSVVGNHIKSYVGTAAIAFGSSKNSSIINNNYIYTCAGYGINLNSAQNTVVSMNFFIGTTSSTSAIYSAGAHCLISGNSIKDYNPSTSTGAIHGSDDYTIVSNNIIEDCDENGIHFTFGDGNVAIGNVLKGTTGSYEAITGFRNGSIISGNYITGYNASAHTAIIAGNYGNGTSQIINNNIIYYCPGTAIYTGGAFGSIIANNSLYGAGTSGNGIVGVAFYNTVVGNVLYKYGNVNTNIGIQTIHGMNPGAYNIIADNMIFDQRGTAIDINDSEYSIINNNIIEGDSSGSYATFAIKDVGDSCIVSNNIIKDYCYLATNTCINFGSSMSKISVSGNMMYNCGGTAIDCNSASYVTVIGNLLFADSTSAKSGIINVNDYSSIINNFISGYGDEASSYGIYVSSGNIVSIIGNAIMNAGANMLSGIRAGDNDDDCIVSNNMLYNLPQIGIDMVSTDTSLISNNVVRGVNSGVSGHHAIANVGGFSVVSGNRIRNANDVGIELDGQSTICSTNNILNSTNEAIIVASSLDSNIISNNYCQDSSTSTVTIDGGGSEVLSIIGNILVESAGSDCGIKGFGQSSIVANNIIKGYGQSGGSAIQSSYSTVCYGTIISNNVISQTSVSMDYCIKLSTQGDKSIIIGNQIGDYITDGSFSKISRGGIYMSGSSHIICANNIITGMSTANGTPGISGLGGYSICFGNWVNSPNGHGIRCDGYDQLKISNNHITDCQGDAIVITNNSTDCQITGNYIENPTDDGIDMSAPGCHRALIANNMIYNTGDDGITISGSNSLVVGNFLRDIYYWGIRASGNNVSICGNYILYTDINEAISVPSATNVCVVGNYVYTNNDDGIYIDTPGGSEYNLVVGNYSIVNGSYYSYYWGGTNNVVAAGNIGKGGHDITTGGTTQGFGTGLNVDSANCKWFA